MPSEDTMSLLPPGPPSFSRQDNCAMTYLYFLLATTTRGSRELLRRLQLDDRIQKYASVKWSGPTRIGLPEHGWDIRQIIDK